MTLQAVIHQLANGGSHPSCEKTPAGNCGLKYKGNTSREASFLAQLVPQEEAGNSASQGLSSPSCRGLLDGEGGSEVEFQAGEEQLSSPGSQGRVRSRGTDVFPAGKGADHYCKTFLLGNFIAI